MTSLLAASLALWVLLTIASIVAWLPPRLNRAKSLLSSTGGLVSMLLGILGGTAAVAVLAGLAMPATGTLGWASLAVAATAAVLTGGAVTTSVLGLADSGSRVSPQRVRRIVLRGGAWIGGLERIGVVASILSGWPEGVAVIVAVKGLARYPELKSLSAGAAERFIIGTFASISWAAACAGVALLLT